MKQKSALILIICLIIGCAGIILTVENFYSPPEERICPQCNGSTDYTCEYCRGDGYLDPGDDGYKDLVKNRTIK